MKLELMDWKNVEATTEQTIRTANVTTVLDEIMLKHAKAEIKKLGGKTSEDEKQEQAAARAHEAAAGKLESVKKSNVKTEVQN